ncbi:hypothetical protein ACGFNP_21510 [Nonomuraea sp. NPDC049269]|uniref:hypothetical protein n=1 Tax=Nonomuraea sp. NPDC049269 TaxID=3364349 RepID=UPI00371ED61B
MSAAIRRTKRDELIHTQIDVTPDSLRIEVHDPGGFDDTGASRQPNYPAPPYPSARPATTPGIAHGSSCVSAGRRIMTPDNDHWDMAGQQPRTDASLNSRLRAAAEAATAIRDMAEPRNAHHRAMHLTHDVRTTEDSAAPDPDMLGAFRRFYVCRDPLGDWRARPLPKLTTEEITFGLQQELVAHTSLELAFACTWQRSRRNVYRYLQEYAVEATCRGPAS